MSIKKKLMDLQGATEKDFKPHDRLADLEERITKLYEYQGLTINENGVVIKETYSADNPITWVDGMTPKDNAFYLKEDGKIYVYMNGQFIEW